MCGENEPKKPRLFYLEEAENVWCPAALALDDNYAEAELDSMDDGEERTIRIKRVDMTDAEYEGLPED